ncbi:putative NRPS-like protein biosynthetic cluster, partial [Apophysomyces sp. BC1015]
LGEIEACLAGHPQVRDAVVLALGEASDKRLIAYVAAKPDESLASTLRAHVAAHHGYRAPHTPQERTLAELFTDVLGVPRVGVDDSFFELGGDSILSIQLVSRARKAGWAITPREVFQHQSVAALASVAKPLDDTRPAVADIATGEVPPTPIIRRFLQGDGPIGRFNQTMLLQVPAALQADHLITALQALLDHHDALRLQLLPLSARGAGWALQIPLAGAVSASACLRRVEIAALGEAVRQARIRQEVQAAETRLDPQAGVMLQAVWFDAGDAPGRLLLTIHHLAVDGVSWRILLPDLASAWQAAQAGQPIALEPTSTSLRRWAQWLSHEALSETRHAELPFWERMLDGADALLSARPLDPAHDTVATAQHLSLTLPATLTAPLLGAVPARFHGRVNDVLLSTFALAVACWRQRQGYPYPDVLIDLEGHGRESLDASLDLSRTVGWFTSLFPVRFELGELDLDAALEGGPTLGRWVKRVKEQLRALPDHGLGFGLLRHLNAETALILEHLPAPQISFNYLSRFAAPEAQDWGPAPESTPGGGDDPAMPLSHAISLNALTLDRPGGPELIANWSWAGALFTVDQMQDLAQTWFQVLEALVAYAEQSHAGGLTPSDVPLVSLSQDQIEQLEVTHPELEDILPLSPLQKGQLFHALQADKASDPYAMPTILDLEGTLDSQALRAAIQALLQRHASLRASFVHQGLNEPVQVIPRTVPLPWQESELSGLDDAAREAAYQRFLQEECSRRFNPTRPPLLRFGLVRLTSNQSRLILICHHILLDGWSMPVLIQELFALYANGGDGRALPRVTPYRDYLAWLNARDHAAAERAWREVLAGLQAPTRLAPARLSTSTPQETLAWTLPETLTRALNQQARQQRLTLNTLVQGAWGLLLSHLTGRDDVVFGVTVAGRPPELPGIEHMVGLLIHTPPLRFQCSPAQPIAEVLARLQDQQICLIEHQHLDLADIERVTGLGQLFDTLVVFENYPVDYSARQAADKLRIIGVSGSTATHYPLSLAAVPGAQLSFQLGYRPDLFDRETAERLTQCLIRLFEAIAQDPEQPVGRIEWLDSLPLIPNVKLERKALPARDSTSSQTPMEKALAQLWAEIFGLEKVYRHDNFFDLGGHSLLAMRLISRIHASLNVNITIRTLFEAPSVAELAQRLLILDGTRENAFAVLLPLQPKGARPPLFCIHPGGGLSWSYIGLSSHLGADQPVYGLQDRGFDGAAPLAETIDAMASDYIEHIRRIQPNGPYHLLGWSFGGYMAHSMATQLEQQGESVALLALLDSDLSPERLSDERELDQDEIYAEAASHYGDEMISAMDERLWETACQVMQNHRRIRRLFSPSTYSGNVLFFRATIAEDEFHPLASSDAWKPYVLGRIAVYDIPCKHGDMIQPEPAAEIGRILARELEELTKTQSCQREGEILE